MAFFHDAMQNLTKVIVLTGYDSSATIVVLAAGEGASLPDPSASGCFNLVWYNSTDYNDPADDPYVEIVRCTSRTTDILTLTRGQENTSAQNHNIVGKTYTMKMAITKKIITDLQNVILKDSGGHYWSVTIDVDGILITTDLGT
jgi:hypothetical protein